MTRGLPGLKTSTIQMWEKKQRLPFCFTDSQPGNALICFLILLHMHVHVHVQNHRRLQKQLQPDVLFFTDLSARGFFFLLRSSRHFSSFF